MEFLEGMGLYQESRGEKFMGMIIGIQGRGVVG